MIEKKNLLRGIAAVIGVLFVAALFPYWRQIRLSRTRGVDLGTMGVRGAKVEAEKMSQRTELEAIQALLAEDKLEEAAAALAAFEEKHPECAVPEELTKVREALGR